MGVKMGPVSKDEFVAFDKAHNQASLDEKSCRRALTESRSVVVHWDVPCLGLWLDDELISINVTNFSKRPRKNAWGRYLNFYLAYTAPAHRLQGYATQLVEHVESTALELGYNRMKSLAGYWPGVRLHMRLGHQFWGIGKNGALLVDTPLRGNDEFPDGIPIEARNGATNPCLMSEEDLVAALQLAPFNQKHDGDLRQIINRYFERLRWSARRGEERSEAI